MNEKGGFFEKRFGSDNGIGPSGWLMLIIGLFVVVLAFFIFWLPETSPILSMKSYFSSETVQPAPDDAVTVVERGGDGTERVFENGHYVYLVHFSNGIFRPSVVVLNHGDSVRFINNDNLTMRVGSRAENLSSVLYANITQATAEGRGAVFEYTFTQPGVWAYENISTAAPRPRGVVFVR